MSSKESDILVSNQTLGYSAEVKMELRLNGRTYPVAQMGIDTITLRDPFDGQSGEGEVVLTIDGEPRRWLVTIREQSFPAKTIKAEFRDPD